MVDSLLQIDKQMSINENELQSLHVNTKMIQKHVQDNHQLTALEENKLSETPISDDNDENKSSEYVATLSPTMDDDYFDNYEPSATFSEYSQVSDNSYEYGVQYSQPLATFHKQSSLPDLLDIETLLTTRNSKLFFVHTNSETDHRISYVNYGKNKHNKKLANITSNSNTDSNSEGDKNTTTDNDVKSDIETGKVSDNDAKDGDTTDNATNNTTNNSANNDDNSAIDDLLNGSDGPKHPFKQSKSKSKRDTNSKEYKDLTFTISEGHVYFNTSAFIREWIYNFFHILILPVIIYYEGISGAKSRLYYGFLCPFNYHAFLGLIYSLMFWFINIVYWMYLDADNYSLDMIIFNTLHILRISIVSVKWAYLPPKIFDIMRQRPLTVDQFAMIHFLGGWIRCHPISMAREIGQSCARLELDVYKLKFKFRDQKKDFSTKKKTQLNLYNMCMCPKRSEYITYGNLLIPYMVYTTTKTLESASHYIGKILNILSPVMLILLVAGRTKAFIGIDNDYKMSLIEYIWLISFIFNASQSLKTLALFSIVIALDFRRRYIFTRFCTALIQPTKRLFKNPKDQTSFKAHMFPNLQENDKNNLKSAILCTLELGDPVSVYNWSLLRSFFLDFGLRFLRREEAALSLFIIAILIIDGFYLSMLWFGIYKSINWFQLGFILLLTVATMVPTFLSLQYAGEINQKVTEQTAILADKRLKLNYDKNEYNINSLEYKNAEQSVIIMSNVINKLNSDNFALRLFGWRIDYTVTGIFAAILGSVGFAVGRLALGGEPETFF